MSAECRAPEADALRSGAHDAQSDSAAQRWVLAASVLGSSVAFTLSSVVNVALPAMQSSLGTNAATMQWVLNAYLLPLAGLILIGGALGDRYGRTRVFAWGLGIVGVATAACAWAPSAGWLIAARAVQGVGAALLVPGSLALLRAFFPPEERGAAIGTWAGAAALTSAAGPLLGGYLVDVAGWRWMFVALVPFAAVALALAVFRLPESRAAHTDGDLDLPGAVLAAAGLGALVFGLIRQGETGWADPRVWGSVSAGVGLLGGFILREARTSAPMMPLTLFRSATFSGANALTMFLYMALGGLSFLFPYVLIGVHGYSATAAGAAFLPFTLLMGGLSRWMGGHIERIGARRMLITGTTVSALGLALFALPGTSGSYWTTFFVPMVVLGLGMTVAVAPLTTVVMNAVDDDQAGTASGINNAASRVAQLLAITLFGALTFGVYTSTLDARAAQADLSAASLAAVASARQDPGGGAPLDAVPPEEQAAVRAATAGALVHGFRWAMGVSAALALMGAAVAAVSIPGRPVAEEPG
ncbi:MAG: MFS transporter [Bacteroidota bacterium]